MQPSPSCSRLSALILYLSSSDQVSSFRLKPGKKPRLDTWRIAGVVVVGNGEVGVSKHYTLLYTRSFSRISISSTSARAKYLHVQ